MCYYWLHYILKEVEKEMLNEGRELLCQEVIELGAKYSTSDTMEVKVLTDYEERQAWSTYNRPTSLVRLCSLIIRIYYANIQAFELKGMRFAYERFFYHSEIKTWRSIPF